MEDVGTVGYWTRGASAVAAILVLVGDAWATPASAGDYDVHACRLPSGAPLADFTGWTNELNGQPTSRSCANASPFDHAVLSVWPLHWLLPDGGGIGDRFVAPAGTHIARVELYRWFDGGDPASDPPYVEYRLRADGRMLEACHSATCVERGSRFVPPVSADNRVVFGSLDAHALTARIECVSTANCLLTQNGRRPPALAIAASRITLADDVPPGFSAPPTGDLLDAGAPLTGARSARFHVIDQGSGIASVAVVVDGVSQGEHRVAPDDARCAVPYTMPVPCPLEHQGAIVFDSARMSNGEHNVALSVRDGSGNHAESPPIRVTTRNRSSPNGAGASSFARVRAWLPERGRMRTSRTVGYGTRVPVAGQLIDERGRPIAGAALDVLARPRRIGAKWRQSESVVTNRRGRFRADLARGSSRLVRVAYRAYSLDAAYTATAETTVNVRSGVHLTASPRNVRNGSHITFRGRLLGGRSRAGVTVVIYAIGRRIRGERARVPVEAVRAGFHGRFRYRYQFRNIAGPFHYRFQARTRADRGFPFAPGRSRIVHVSARP